MMARIEAGFTLIETLVALIILIAMTTFLYRGFSGGLYAADAAEGAEAALLVAQARLAALGVEAPLAAGEQEGAEGNVLGRTAIRPYVMPGRERTVRQQPQAFWATVTVSWRQRRGGPRRSLQLTTVKLGKAE